LYDGLNDPLGPHFSMLASLLLGAPYQWMIEARRGVWEPILMRLRDSLHYPGEDQAYPVLLPGHRYRALDWQVGDSTTPNVDFMTSTIELAES